MDTACHGHQHPFSRAVDRGLAERELLRMAESAGVAAGVVRWPSFMNERHARSPRSYAQVTPGAVPVYDLAEAVRWLPARNRSALFAHEVGHALDPLGGEDDADRAAEAALGFSIGYDERWPGKGLQTMARSNPSGFHPDGRMIPSPGDEVFMEHQDAHGFRQSFRGKVMKPRAGARSYTIKLTQAEGGTLLGALSLKDMKKKTMTLTTGWSVVGDPVAEKALADRRAAESLARDADLARRKAEADGIASSKAAALAGGHLPVSSWSDLKVGDRVFDHNIQEELVVVSVARNGVTVTSPGHEHLSGAWFPLGGANPDVSKITLIQGARENRGGVQCDSGLEQWEDGFCPPRGELAQQPADKWLHGCSREVAMAVGQELGDLSVKSLAKEQKCSEMSVRNILRELEGMGAVKSYQPMAGLKKKGGRAYRLTEAGMDLADWIQYRDEVHKHYDTDFDPSEFGQVAPSADPGAGDPWDWRAGRDLGDVDVRVQAPESSSGPYVLRAYVSKHPEEPAGELELWPTGLDAGDERQFGRVGPEAYASVGSLRVSPKFRREGIATILLEDAAKIAERHGLPLASPDNRTPEEAAWWTKQVRKGRAQKIRHRSRKHPEASRYLLKYPPPASLENPHAGHGLHGAAFSATPEQAAEYLSRVMRRDAGAYVDLAESSMHEFVGEVGSVLARTRSADGVGVHVIGGGGAGAVAPLLIDRLRRAVGR